MGQSPVVAGTNELNTFQIGARSIDPSRMLLGGPGPDGTDPQFRTQGAIFYEVRSVGQKSNGMLEQLFVRPTMAVLAAAADGSLYAHPGTGWEDIPFGEGEPCGGGPF